MTACLQAAFEEADSETTLKNADDEFKERLARVRLCAKLFNSSVVRQSRERTGTGAHRFMEQGMIAPKRTETEKEKAFRWICAMKGKCFKEKSSPETTWRLRADTDIGGGEGDGVNFQCWDEDDRDYHIVYYNVDTYGDTDPGKFSQPTCTHTRACALTLHLQNQ